MVDTSFSRLTERLYRSTPWPPAAAIAPLVDGDAVFLLLYKELTFRHLHACCAGTVTLRDRAASWENYRALFDIVLNANLNVRLPASWLWDVVDEFCYQFQAFHQARSRAEAAVASGGGGGAGGGGGGSNKSSVSSLDTADLRGPAGAAWPAAEVSRYLSDLAARAALDDASLSTPAGAAAFAAADGGSGPDGKGSNVLRLLGLFARLGLARVRCCLGDYEGSLQALGAALNPMMMLSNSSSSAPSDETAASTSSSSSSVASTTAAALSGVVPNRHLYTLKVAGAHVCLHYYAGFSYLMLGRYVDAARTLDAALAHVSRVKQFHARSQGYDALLKKNEQCAALLALVLALCPGAAGGSGGGVAGFGGGAFGGGYSSGGASSSSPSRLSDAAASALREKHADKVARMSRSAQDASWEDLFAYGCPKFVPTESSSSSASSASSANGGGENENGSGSGNAAQAAYRAQLRAFLGVVASRRHLPPLRQLLRIYTKAGLPKLTALMNSSSAAAASSSSSDPNNNGASSSSSSSAPLSVDEVREALHQLIAAQTCVTWCGPTGTGPESGVALQGCAVDVELELSTDPATGEELVEVVSAEGSSGNAENASNVSSELAAGVEALARQVEAISGVVKDLAALPPLVV